MPKREDLWVQPLRCGAKDITDWWCHRNPAKITESKLKELPIYVCLLLGWVILLFFLTRLLSVSFANMLEKVPGGA